MATKKYVFIPNPDVPDTHKPLLNKVVQVLAKAKADKTAAEDRAHSRQTNALGKRNANVHQVLWTYEKAHLAAGDDWEAVKGALRGPVNSRTGVLVTDFWDEEMARGTAVIEGEAKVQVSISGPTVKTQTVEKRVRLGTVFLGEARFTDLRPQPTGLRNKVYVLGRFAHTSTGAKLEQDPNHTACHFVRQAKRVQVKVNASPTGDLNSREETTEDRNASLYVRRFVTRGLNHNDIINLANNSPLGAPVLTVTAERRETTASKASRHPLAAGDVMTEGDQILSHARGWAKRYISTGVSDRAVFSTRGTQFMSLFGTAVIDLAQVDPATVFDIHSPLAVKRTLGWDATEVSTATGHHLARAGLDEEKYLALRDVLRTRELLIKGQVPRAAVKAVADGKRIVAIGGDGPNAPDVILNGLKTTERARVVQSDTINYPGYNGKYWAFLLFRDEIDALWFWNNYREPRWASMLRLTRYVMPTTLPGWK
jgi:hypothetical protein